MNKAPLTCAVVLGHVSRVRARGLQRQTWIFSVAPASVESETRVVVRQLHTVSTGYGGAFGLGVKLQSHENDVTNKKKMSLICPRHPSYIFYFLISSKG
ncbi:hypothetical protein M0R45_013276 [Rubus argutus]|uniref:Uncharacterized protein n=1 Tax=Rubus argutus TaxID=59490 RepID=A0AAW1XKM8_RUBAR